MDFSDSLEDSDSQEELLTMAHSPDERKTALGKYAREGRIEVQGTWPLASDNHFAVGELVLIPFTGENPVWFSISVLLFASAFLILYPLLPAIVETMTDTTAEASRYVGIMYATTDLIIFTLRRYASNSFTSFFLHPLLGAWADRIGRKKCLINIYTLTLVFTVALAVAVHFKLLWLMFTVRTFNLAIAQSVC